ncbi:MAG: hypothetical protein RLZZ156_1581 [Deinococcota bacterium]
MRYELDITQDFRKQFVVLDKTLEQRVLNEINLLLENPKKQGVIQMTGLEEFRTRVGDYRIVFTVDETNRIVELYKVGHRSFVYER